MDKIIKLDDNPFVWLDSYSIDVSKEELFVYAYIIGYIHITKDYKFLDNCSLLSLTIDQECKYTDYCVKCGAVYPCLNRLKERHGTNLEYINNKYTFINVRGDKTKFCGIQKIRF